MMFLSNNRAVESQPLLRLLEASVARLRQVGIESVLISAKPVQSARVVNLLDQTSEVIEQFGVGPTVVTVDRAGFIRHIQEINDSTTVDASMLSAVDPTPKLEVGRKAPDFTMADMNGKAIRSRDFIGKQNVLLTFFPKCFTGGCQNHLSSLRDHIAEFSSSDTTILAVSIDPADVQIEFAHRWGLPFSLIPDTGRNLSILYEATVDTEQLADRQSVLIDKNGIVRFIDKHVNVQTHGDDILEKMRELGIAK